MHLREYPLVMPIETLLTFNRLKQLSNDIKVVTDAIKTSDKLLVVLGWFLDV